MQTARARATETGLQSTHALAQPSLTLLGLSKSGNLDPSYNALLYPSELLSCTSIQPRYIICVIALVLRSLLQDPKPPRCLPLRSPSTLRVAEHIAKTIDPDSHIRRAIYAKFMPATEASSSCRLGS